jgi:hypothetical protein
MRKFLLFAAFVALLIGLLCVWLFAGKQIVLQLDRFRTEQISIRPFRTLTYEGDGNGGVLHLDDVSASLNETGEGAQQPHIGTTPDGQLALSYAGQVFSFGQLPKETDRLSVPVPATDQASFELRRSLMPWPNLFEVNFMTGNTPRWKRNRYQHLIWQKQSGARLDIWWRFEQFYYVNDGWVDGDMSDPGLTGIIRIEIKPPGRP